MLEERPILESNLIHAMTEFKLKTKKTTVKDIKDELRKYKVIDAQKWINNPNKEIPKLDIRELFLLTEQVYLKTGYPNLNPSNYFTEQEQKKSRQHVGTYSLVEEIDFPLTLEGFTRLSHNEYAGTIPANIVAKLAMSRKLHYNFDIQRESVKRKVKDTVVREAKLVMQNVIEIKDHLKSNTLKPTQLVFNAAIGSADNNEPELIYDEIEKKLTVTRGTILDIVDGYHRTKGTELAYSETGDIDFTFTVLITNYSDDEAKIFQGQIAKQTPIAKERAAELLGERMADAVLKELIPKSELKGRVSNSRHVYKIDEELVAYKVLAEAIEENFDIKKMLDVYKVSEYLIKFFNYLIGTFEDEFKNPKYESLIANNNMFVGYIALASRFMKENEDPSKVIEVVSSIDFSRSNKMWKNLGVINEKGAFDHKDKPRESVRDFFLSIDINRENEKVK